MHSKLVTHSSDQQPLDLVAGGNIITYYVQKRPLADYLLSACRTIAPVWMLTSSTRRYCVKINQQFDLGFRTNILAREDYLVDVDPNYGYPNITDFDKSGVLIDNNPVIAPLAQLKLLTLGVGYDRYFQIREYVGQVDPDCFKLEVDQMVDSITKFFHTV